MALLQSVNLNESASKGGFCYTSMSLSTWYLVCQWELVLVNAEGQDDKERHKGLLSFKSEKACYHFNFHAIGQDKRLC